MRALLTAYNKSVRKKTYTAIKATKKGMLKSLIEKDFKIIAKKNGKHQYKHKDGRFTKIY